MAHEISIDPKYAITRIMKINLCRNPISGHEWIESVPLNRFKVSGGLWIPTYHKSEKAAERELAEMKAFDAKFPPVVWRSEREERKRKALGL